MVLLGIFDFIHLQITDIIDILLVGFLLLQLHRWTKGTAAMKIFIGIALIYAAWKLVSAFQMMLLSEILGEFISVGMIALIIVFQPEIREFLLMVGNNKFFKKAFKFTLIKHFREIPDDLDISSIIKACRHMANHKTGALIIIARDNHLEDYVKTGEVIDAKISRELIENIFFKNSPLHDGALLVIDYRLKAARCILPVTKNEHLPSDLGLRHRSAIGISEATDALAIVVSEQTGQIAIAIDGHIQRDLSPSLLEQILIENLDLNRSKNDAQKKEK